MGLGHRSGLDRASARCDAERGHEDQQEGGAAWSERHVEWSSASGGERYGRGQPRGCVRA